MGLIAKKFSSAELAAQEMKTFVDNYIHYGEQMERDILMHPILSTELDALWKEVGSRYGIEFRQ